MRVEKLISKYRAEVLRLENCLKHTYMGINKRKQTKSDIEMLEMVCYDLEKLRVKCWPDEIRLQMIEKSEFYPNDKIYQFGYYDGWMKQFD